MTNKQLYSTLTMLFLIGVLNAWLLGGEQKEKSLFDDLEIDEYYELPVIPFEDYTDTELKAVLEVMQKQGVSLQKALMIPLATAISIEDVLNEKVDFETYAKNIKIILDSTAYYIDDYETFETDNRKAEQYHTSMVLASRQLHNGLVFYYSSVVYNKETEQFEVNEPMLKQGKELVGKYYDYIGMNEYIYDYIDEVDSEGVDKFIDKVNKETEILMDDIKEKIK